jgi:predicted  nucleic acid-binding Zn-ribbon protein
MKIKIGLVVLATACVGLLVALFATKKSADDQRTKDSATILQFSNDLGTASTTMNDLRQVNLMLTNDLASVHQLVAVLSNNLAMTSGTLSNTKASLQSAESQIANLNGRITDLEEQNKALDERAAELTNKLAQMDALIAATQHKLANAEADNAFLAGELQKQMAQKAELERKFADLNVVRAQVKKLRDELFVARRLQWIASGVDPTTPLKGGAVLMQRGTVSVSPASTIAAQAKAEAARQPAKPASPFDLNVEVGSDGTVHVIPPPAGPQDTPVQAAARAALLKQMDDTNAAAH